MTSRPVRINFCLKMARLWSEFRINFNQYSIRSFQRAMVGFNNLRIHFIFILFNSVSRPKISIPPLQMDSWAMCLRGYTFSSSRGNCIFFLQFTFWYILEYYKFGLCMYHSLEKRIWFTIIFLLLKKTLTLFQIWIFLL